MNKRNLCGELASSLGLARIVETLARRDCLLVLNYHRIGDSSATEFDEGVFSATAEDFERQVSYLKRRFSILTLDEAVDAAASGRRFRGAAVLITFDDGYIDNYQVAFPILRSLQTQGTFFLVSAYLNNPIIPWWDRIAYLVRNTKQRLLRLNYPETVEFPLDSTRRAAVIRSVLSLYKSPKTEDPKRFLEELEAASSPCPDLPPTTRLFLNCDEARDLVRGGMAVGSHTRSHQILSKLSREEQLAEVTQSRMALNRELGVPIDTLAYPVGERTAFDETSRSVLREAGYRAAFSFYGGLNRSGAIDCFDVKRFGVESVNPFARFRLQVAGAVATDGYWF